MEDKLEIMFVEANTDKTEIQHYVLVDRDTAIVQRHNWDTNQPVIEFSTILNELNKQGMCSGSTWNAFEVFNVDKELIDQMTRKIGSGVAATIFSTYKTGIARWIPPSTLLFRLMTRPDYWVGIIMIIATICGVLDLW